jgi:hypothetical protein
VCWRRLGRWLKEWLRIDFSELRPRENLGVLDLGPSSASWSPFRSCGLRLIPPQRRGRRSRAPRRDRVPPSRFALLVTAERGRQINSPRRSSRSGTSAPLVLALILPLLLRIFIGHLAVPSTMFIHSLSMRRRTPHRLVAVPAVSSALLVRHLARLPTEFRSHSEYPPLNAGRIRLRFSRIRRRAPCLPYRQQRRSPRAAFGGLAGSTDLGYGFNAQTQMPKRCNAVM